jgi:hypothetical protein
MSPEATGRTPTLTPRKRPLARRTRQSATDHRRSKKSGLTVRPGTAESRVPGEALMDAVCALAPRVGIRAACQALTVPRATFYRHRPPLTVPPLPEPATEASPPRHSPRALRPEEQAAVLATLHSEEFQNMAPAAVQAHLLDQGRYLCSTRTMYRLHVVHTQVSSAKTLFIRILRSLLKIPKLPLFTPLRPRRDREQTNRATGLKTCR